MSPTKSAILTRLSTILKDDYLRRILVGKSTIDIEKEINSGKVIICNMAKGRMGKKSAVMLGKFIIAIIQGYAMKREEMDEKYYKDSLMFIDEMQNYVTENSIKDILAESRKYALYLVLANQVLGQDMTKGLRNMILGNTALKFCGDNEIESLEIMGKSMKGLKLKDFDRLKKYHFYSYNKLNKKQGAKMIKVPPNLTKVKPPYYMTKEALKKYFLWLANDSGYYVKQSSLEEKESKKADIPRNRKGGGTIYQNDFID